MARPRCHAAAVCGMEECGGEIRGRSRAELLAPPPPFCSCSSWLLPLRLLSCSTEAQCSPAKLLFFLGRPGQGQACTGVRRAARLPHPHSGCRHGRGKLPTPPPPLPRPARASRQICLSPPPPTILLGPCLLPSCADCCAALCCCLVSTGLSSRPPFPSCTAMSRLRPYGATTTTPTGRLPVSLVTGPVFACLPPSCPSLHLKRPRLRGSRPFLCPVPGPLETPPSLLASGARRGQAVPAFPVCSLRAAPGNTLLVFSNLSSPRFHYDFCERLSRLFLLVQPALGALGGLDAKFLPPRRPGEPTCAKAGVLCLGLVVDWKHAAAGAAGSDGLVR